jgi:DNA-binding PadR family transcriptional regulator
MTGAELTVLSLIAEQPRHGYQIDQVIVEREMRQWTDLGFSSIYFILKKLERAQLIESRIEPAVGKGPARHVYQITQLGWEAFQKGTLAALAEPPSSNSTFLLALSNLPAVPRREASAAVRHYQDRLVERKEHLLQRQKLGEGKFPFHVNAIFEFGLVMIHAELEWVEGFLREMEAQNDQT